MVGTISTQTKGMKGSGASPSDTFKSLGLFSFIISFFHTTHRITHVNSFNLSLVHGLCSCLQENDLKVKEEAIKSLIDIQTLNTKNQNQIINGSEAGTIAGVLTGKLFTIKFGGDIFSQDICKCATKLIEVRRMTSQQTCH